MVLCICALQAQLYVSFPGVNAIIKKYLFFAEKIGDFYSFTGKKMQKR
jgi:hypothetical protein